MDPYEEDVISNLHLRNTGHKFPKATESQPKRKTLSPRQRRNMTLLQEAWKKLPENEKKNYHIIDSSFRRLGSESPKSPTKNPTKVKTKLPRKPSSDFVTQREMYRNKTIGLNELQWNYLCDEPPSPYHTSEFGVISKVQVDPSMPEPTYFSIYISDLSVANDLCTLRQNNIKAILSLGMRNRPSSFTTIKQGYMVLDFEDDEHSDLIGAIEHSYKFIESSLAEGNVLVHCYRGRNRSCALVIGFLMQHYKIPYEEAYEIVKNSRTCCKLASYYERQLKHFRLEHN